MEKVFAPGCALMLYKPHLANKLHSILNQNIGEMDILSTCCKHEPELNSLTEIINICPGCDKRFRNDYKNTTTISIWELLAGSNFFPFPNYNGKQMTIMDACPVREREDVQNAIRTILKRMNIILVEPVKTGKQSVCCGDSFYGLIPTEQVKEQMCKRTSEMPLDDIVVYCVSCIKSVYIGGKNPHHLIDLIFKEETPPQTLDMDAWHKELDQYILKH